jgi:hypothetical protein
MVAPVTPPSTGARRFLRWLLLAIPLTPLALVGTCAARSHWWSSGAERAIAAAVQATSEGRVDPRVDVVLHTTTSTGARWDPRVDFHSKYLATGADAYPRGTSLMALLDPGASSYVVHLEFANGHTYHAEAVRQDGRWVVSLEPAERQ